MALMIDTSVFVAWERTGTPIDFSPWSHFGPLRISVITISEMLVGVHRADTEPRRLKRAAFVNSVIAKFPSLDVTADVARTHAAAKAKMQMVGQIIGAHDLIIAATALHHGCTVLTANPSEFTRVPGLNVVELVHPPRSGRPSS